MAGITLAQAETNLSKLMAAAALEDGAASISFPDGRSVTYRDIGAINQAIAFWDVQVKRLSRGGLAVRGISPR